MHATIARSPRTLTADHIARYHRDGFIAGLTVYDAAGATANRAGFEHLMRALPLGHDAFAINAWHRTNRFVYDLCTHPRILDCVEDLIGPDILLWGSHFFSKEPGDGAVVAWHQDARYWPLAPHRTVTAWLAIDDSDVGNAAMRVVPGTQRRGLLPHHGGAQADGATLDLQIPAAEIAGMTVDDQRATAIELRSGQISLHDDNLVHGSPANTSARRRCGLTMRFMPPEVRCDREIWPEFSAILVRGSDTQQHNPTLPPPGPLSVSTPCVGMRPYGGDANLK